MMNNIKALLVDDDPRYAASFVDKAFLRNIEIVHKEDWETALTELKENFLNYVAVILDGKGKLSQDQRGDDPKHLSRALQDINLLRGENKFIRYFINTAYFDTLVEYFGTDNFFDKKKNQEDLLLDEIIKTAANIDIYRLKEEFSDVFECFGPKYLQEESSVIIIKALLSIKDNTWSSDSFNPLRKIIESIYIKLHEYDDKLIPYGCLRYENDQVNFKHCELRLTGKDIRENASIIYTAVPSVLPIQLSLVLGPITKICSIASHVVNKKHLTQYSFQTIVWVVMDMIIWFKKHVDENYL